MKDLSASIEKHYSEWPSFEAILENLNRKRIDLQEVRPRDLYPYDQSHAGGVDATAMLARMSGLKHHDTVVDVGCGTGGAARYLHAELSCRVVGIDLTLARLRAGADLNHLTRLEDKIWLLAGQAEALPLAAHCADVVWSQHVTMNLPDHPSFLRECARVLNSAGRLACHEWFLTRGGKSRMPSDLPFPLPWAPDPTLNHAVSSERFLQMLRDQNFVPRVEDVTVAMAESLRKDVQVLASRGAPPGRVAARANLLQAAAGGLLHCLMISAVQS